MSLKSRPAFEDLPLRDGDPPFSAWGLYGDDDQLGTLNLLTPDVVKNAASEIQTGVRVGLDLAINNLTEPTHNRKALQHHIIWKEPRAVHDDEVSFNTQSSSQWDGLRHMGYQREQVWYNGIKQPAISGSEANEDVLGIQAWCKRGIVGRGVLLDYYHWTQNQGISYELLSSHSITVEDLVACARSQNVEFASGDILFVRSGWKVGYDALSPEEKLSWSRQSPARWAGVETSINTLKWLWDNAFSACAGDAPGWETVPFPSLSGEVGGLGTYCLHEALLGGWGMPIGEMFNLDDLSEECHRQGRYSFFVSSVPLFVPGGVASPPNIVAIF